MSLVISNSGRQSLLEGASTIALADSLQVETDVAVFDFRSGKSGHLLIRDSDTPANDVNIAEMSQAETDLLTLTAPDPKYLVGPDGKLRYQAHNRIKQTKWASDWTYSNATSAIADDVLTLTDDGTFGPHQVSQNETEIGTIIGQRYRTAVEVKAGTGRYISVRNPARSSGNNRAWITFDTQTQAIDANGQVAASSFKDLGGGWYRIAVESIAGKVDATGSFVVAMSSASTAPSVGSSSGNSYTGSGDTFEIRNPQISLCPADETFFHTTTAPRYALPIDYYPDTHDTSTSTLTPSLGDKTVTVAATASTPLAVDDMVRVSEDGDLDGNWFSGKVSAKDGNDVTVAVDQFEGGTSTSSWHIIKYKGVYIEGQETNQCDYSRDLQAAYWAGGNAPVRTSGQTGFDGLPEAWEIEDNSATQNSYIVRSEAITANNEPQTVSVFIEKTSGTPTFFPELQLDLTGGTTQYADVQINTQTGATLVRASVGSVSGRTRDYGAWWRLVVTVDNDGSNSIATMRFYPAVGSTWGGTEVAAQGAITIDQFDLVDRTAETSPIFTDGATVTRAKDEIDFNVSDMPFDDGGEGFLMVGTYSEEFPPSGTNYWAMFHSGGSSSQIGIYETSVWRALVNNGANVVSPTLQTNQIEQRVAASWQLNDANCHCDGASATPDTTVTPASGQTLLSIGQTYASAGQANGWVQFVKSMPRHISDADANLETS